jgi:hypothetical protein
MPCFALQNRGGKLNCLHDGLIVDSRSIALGATLGYHVTCAGFTATALSGNTKLKLDFVETHPCMRMVCDFAIRNSVAYTNDHGCKQLWLAIDMVERIINANSSHLQTLSIHRVNLALKEALSPCVQA